MGCQYSRERAGRDTSFYLYKLLLIECKFYISSYPIKIVFCSALTLQKDLFGRTFKTLCI